jgi:hypothetical protein
MKFRTLFALFLFAGAVFAAAIGQLDTPGVVIALLSIVIGYLGYAFVAVNEEGEVTENSEEKDSEDSVEQIKNAETNKDVIEVLKHRERELFNTEIYSNTQNAMWDTFRVDRGEGEEEVFRAYLLTEKQSNQDMIYVVNLTKGTIPRRAQRLEDIELYNLFENSSSVESLQKNSMSSSSQVMDRLRQLMQQKNSGGSSQGLSVDSSSNSDSSDDEPDENGILEKEYKGA